MYQYVTNYDSLNTRKSEILIILLQIHALQPWYVLRDMPIHMKKLVSLARNALSIYVILLYTYSPLFHGSHSSLLIKNIFLSIKLSYYFFKMIILKADILLHFNLPTTRRCVYDMRNFFLSIQYIELKFIYDNSEPRHFNFEYAYHLIFWKR